jgi:cell division protein FtsL
MKTTVALLVALLLTATEFLVMAYDSRQRVALYETQAATVPALRE